MRVKQITPKFKSQIKNVNKELNSNNERDQITCPYCYSFTHFIYGQECKCEVCRQYINDGDLSYENT